MASKDVIEQVALRAMQSAASGSRKGASQQVIDAVRERAAAQAQANLRMPRTKADANSPAYPTSWVMGALEQTAPKTTGRKLKDDLKAIGSSFMAGISDASNAIVKTVDFLIPQEHFAGPGRERGQNAINDIFQYYYDTHDTFDRQAEQANEKAGPVAQTVNQWVTRPVAAALPQSLMALMSGGASAAAGTGAALSSAGQAATTGQILSTGLQGLVKDPGFWYSVAQTTGQSYDEAKENGANDEQAAVTALLNGFAGSVIEVGGGLEKIPDTPAGIKNWISSMVDEGKEEVLQGITEKLIQKGVYDTDKSLFQVNGDDAVVDPVRAAQEFAGGAIVGGVLGGAMNGVQAAQAYAEYSRLGKAVMQSEGGMETALSIGLANAKTTEEYQAALRMAKDIEKGKAPSAYAVGKLVADSQSEQAVRSRQINSLLMKSAEEYKASAETADAVAAVATRFGRPIVFADPEKLNGAAGLYDADSDVIAVSPKLTTREAVDFVLKHELTHAIEGSETYADLAALVRQQMGEEGFAAAVEKMAEQRRAAGDESGAQSAEKEVIADWIGNNLFRKGFADKVTAKSRTLGEQFYRALWNVRRALGFTDSASQSERIRAAERAFADQLQSDYRRGEKAEANVDAIAGLENVQYSIKTAPDGQKYVDIDVDQSLFDGLTDIEKLKMAEMIIRERFVGKVIGEEETAYVTKHSAKEYGHPVRHLDADVLDAKTRASTELDNLVSAASNWRNEKDGKDGHTHARATGGFDHGDVVFKVGDTFFSGIVNIEVTDRGRILKDITKIKKIVLDSYQSTEGASARVFQNDFSDTSVSQDNTDVNTQYMQNGAENVQSPYLPATKRKGVQASERTAPIADGYSRNTLSDTSVSQETSDVNTQYMQNGTDNAQRAYLPDDLSAQERAAQAENAKRLANRTDEQAETDTETDVDTDTEAEYDEAAMDEMIDKAAGRRRTKLQQAQREETARLTEQLKNGKIDADTFGREMERLRSEAVADNEKKWRRGERGPMEQREQIRRERRTARADYVEKKAQLEADTAAQKAADTQKRRADSERKKKTEYRRQASKIVDELDSLLSHPSKDRHVPLEALNTVREVLETVSEDPQGIRQEMDEIRRQMAETADQRKITRLERQLDDRKKRLAKVSDMLGRVQDLGKTTEGEGFALAQNDFFAKKIAALRESMDGKTIDALTANETKEVVDVLRGIVKQMRDINTFHSNAMREGVTDTAVRFIREMDAASAYGRLGETIRNMMTWQLTPDRFFEAVCGWKTDSVGKQIADSMTEAEKKELSIRREFGDLFDDAVNGKGRKSYDALGDTKHLVDIGLRDAKGQPMQMTRGMMLSLYMQLNCPANRQALIDSGFIVPELKRYYKGDVENAYANGQRLTPTALSGEIHDVLVKMANAQTDIERQNLDAELTALTVRANQDLDAVAETIAGLMTDDERQFVKLAQQWFNDISKKHINEATREVWGYEAARVRIISRCIAASSSSPRAWTALCRT